MAGAELPSLTLGASLDGETALPAVRFHRNARSRRYILKLSPAGEALVTIPRGGNRAGAVDFVRRNLAWIQAQLAKVPPPWGDGTIVLLRGSPERISLRTEPGPEAALQVEFAGVTFRIESLPSLRPALERHLRRLAARELPGRVFELARHHQLEVARVSVRNQRSRWGSCSRKKTISLNWRLIQTPDFTRDYVILHELMHLREMNHSPRFWAHVQAACPHHREARTWLRAHANLLG